MKISLKVITEQKKDLFGNATQKEKNTKIITAKTDETWLRQNVEARLLW